MCKVKITPRGIKNYPILYAWAYAVKLKDLLIDLDRLSEFDLFVRQNEITAHVETIIAYLEQYIPKGTDAHEV